MKWEIAEPDRTAGDSLRDWDLHVQAEGVDELETIGFVSELKKGGYRAMSFAGRGSASIHLTLEDAQENLLAQLVTWRLGK
jgi:hypothetical protein